MKRDFWDADYGIIWLRPIWQLDPADWLAGRPAGLADSAR